MKTCIFPTYEALSRKAAQIVSEVIRNRKSPVLGLATGGTPLGMYRELIRLHRTGKLDFSGVQTFNLDEYVGLPKAHPQSFYTFMQEHFFRHVNIPPEQIHFLNGDAASPEEECRRYEETLQSAGGIDLQVLGIGGNGHIGFNEPGSSRDSGTRLVRLTEATRNANARFFADPDDVPQQAITMGIRTILDHSRHILLLANGVAKAKAVAGMMEGEVTAELPASFLQQHPQVTVLLDQEAASRLNSPQNVL